MKNFLSTSLITYMKWSNYFKDNKLLKPMQRKVDNLNKYWEVEILNNILKLRRNFKTEKWRRHFYKVQLWSLFGVSYTKAGLGRQLQLHYKEVKGVWSEVRWLSRVPLFATPWTMAYQALPSMGRVLEWVAISLSRGSSQPRDRSRVSRIAGRCFNLWATREAQERSIERCKRLKALFVNTNSVFTESDY